MDIPSTSHFTACPSLVSQSVSLVFNCSYVGCVTVLTLWRLSHNTFLSKFFPTSVEHYCSEGSQASPICPSGKCNTWMKINTHHRWNYTDRRKPKYSDRNLSQCQSVHYRSNTNWPGIDPEHLKTKFSGLYLNIQSVPRSKHSVSVIQTNQLMLYREIIAVCSQIHTKHINRLCGQNVELLNVKLAVPLSFKGLLREQDMILFLYLSDRCGSA
jgi:hypothetical protein